MPRRVQTLHLQQQTWQTRRTVQKPRRRRLQIHRPAKLSVQRTETNSENLFQSRLDEESLRQKTKQEKTKSTEKS